MRPSNPRDEAVWDPAIVLPYLGSLYPNEVITTELLTYKVVTLLALVTAHRVQTLSLIDINNIVHTDKGVEIKIPAKLKLQHITRSSLFYRYPWLRITPSYAR